MAESKLDRIINNLSRTIAVPRAPGGAGSEKEQKSWHGLKPGQWLRTKQPLHYAGGWIREDNILVVRRCTNKGVDLAPTTGEPFRWHQENWEERFVRARKPGKGETDHAATQ